LTIKIHSADVRCRSCGYSVIWHHINLATDLKCDKCGSRDLEIISANPLKLPVIVVLTYKSFFKFFKELKKQKIKVVSVFRQGDILKVIAFVNPFKFVEFEKENPGAFEKLKYIDFFKNKRFQVRTNVYLYPTNVKRFEVAG